AEAAARAREPNLVAEWLDVLASSRRALKLRIGGQERWTAIEDAARFRDALGVALPMGVPEAFLEAVADPLGDLIARFARTHGPFTASQAAAPRGLGAAVAEGALATMEAAGSAVRGELPTRPPAPHLVDPP